MKLISGKIKFKIVLIILLTHLLTFVVGYYAAVPPENTSKVIIADANNCVNVEGNIFCAR